MNLQEFRERQARELAILRLDMTELSLIGHPAAKVLVATAYALSEIIVFHEEWETEWARTGKPRHYARGTI